MTLLPNNDIQVRQASLEHLDTIVDFNITMAKEPEDKDLDIETVKLGVEAMLTQNEMGFYLIAECTGRPVGQLMVTYEWSDWRNAFFWWIQSVYVIPKFRRRGVYKSMHLYVATEAHRHKNVGGLRLYVDKDNTVAQRVYSSLHMSPTHYDMYEIEFATRPDR